MKSAPRFPSFAACVIVWMLVADFSCASETRDAKSSNRRAFPAELVRFSAYSKNPVFAGTGKDTWDSLIRERGYILRERDAYYLWYTGYNKQRSGTMHLGLATSTDGITWKRVSDKPIFDGSWVEDMCVVNHEGVYTMFAEGKHDIAHMLTSTDRLHWHDHGSLDIRQENAKPLSSGPYGTPTIWIENGIWYLFYERHDAGVWLATSKDRRVWTNVQDDPVLSPGPEPYDRYGIALNQVIKYKGRYYGYYHGTSRKNWGLWSTNVAMSDDLVHWEKYPANPVVEKNCSSGILVNDGHQYRLYTMHPKVRLFFPKATGE